MATLLEAAAATASRARKLVFILCPFGAARVPMTRRTNSRNGQACD
ncbi:hypothetical protein [Acetobacter sicerae]|nr:hypothetical protein [Acetobacter sicerae]